MVFVYDWFWVNNWIGIAFSQVDPRPGVLRLMDEAKAAVRFSNAMNTI